MEEKLANQIRIEIDQLESDENEIVEILISTELYELLDEDEFSSAITENDLEDYTFYKSEDITTLWDIVYR